MSYERPGFDPTDSTASAPDDMHIEHLRLQNFGVHIIDTDRLLAKAHDTPVLLTDSTFGPEGQAVAMRAHVITRPQNTRIFKGIITLDHANGKRDEYFSDEPRFDGVAIEPLAQLPHARLIRDPASGFETVVVFREDGTVAHVQNELSLRQPESHGHMHAVIAPSGDFVKNERAQLLHYLNSLIVGAYVACDIDDPGLRSLDMDDLVITPDGPMLRNPQTGEYVHSNRHPMMINLSATPTPYEPPLGFGKQGPPSSLPPSVGRPSRQGNNAPGRPHWQVPDQLPSEELTVPTTTFDELYTIDHIRKALKPVIDYYRHPAVMQQWKIDRPPSGIVLQGPPGTGKTTIFSALANAINAKLKTVSSADIYDQYIGLAERNLKAIFDSVRDATEPTILLFDELDTIISTGGDGKDSGSFVLNSVSGIFKTETQRIANANSNVIFGATTNRPDALDPGIIRAGRFDLKLTVEAPNDEARRALLADIVIDANGPAFGGLSPDMFEGPGPLPGFETIFKLDSFDAAHMQRLVRLTEGYTAADIKTAVNRAKQDKATAQINGRKVSLITAGDLEAVITAMRRSA